MSSQESSELSVLVRGSLVNSLFSTFSYLFSKVSRSQTCRILPQRNNKKVCSLYYTFWNYQQRFYVGCKKQEEMISGKERFLKLDWSGYNLWELSLCWRIRLKSSWQKFKVTFYPCLSYRGYFFGCNLNATLLLVDIKRVKRSEQVENRVNTPL